MEIESQNAQAPEAYKDFLSRLMGIVQASEKESEMRDNIVKQLQENYSKSCMFVQMAKENYDHLASLYEKEHHQFLELQEHHAEMEPEYEPQLKQHEQMTDELKQIVIVTEKEKEALEKEFETYKENTTKKAEKEGYTRRDIEQVLLIKDAEIEVLEKKASEVRRLVKQTEERTMKHTTAATMLQITYMQKNRPNKA